LSPGSFVNNTTSEKHPSSVQQKKKKEKMTEVVIPASALRWIVDLAKIGLGAAYMIIGAIYFTDACQAAAISWLGAATWLIVFGSVFAGDGAINVVLTLTGQWTKIWAQVIMWILFAFYLGWIGIGFWVVSDHTVVCSNTLFASAASGLTIIFVYCVVGILLFLVSIFLSQGGAGYAKVDTNGNLVKGRRRQPAGQQTYMS
jgi:hypothetical protein